MRKISFVATRPKKFKIGAWIIMRVLRTDYSHVAFLFHSSGKPNKFYPYEATGHNNVNFIGQHVWEENNSVVWIMDKFIEDENYDEVLDFAMSMCGIKYAWLQNVGIKFCDWFGIKNNPWTNGFNCSELIKLLAEKLGYILKDDGNRITPRQAVNSIRNAEDANG